MTLNRFFVEQQQQHPEAMGEFTSLMNQVGTTAKIIANHMRRTALEGLLGQTGSQNVQGEDVKRLDEVSNQIFVEAFEYVDIVGMLISEEMTEAKLVAPKDVSSGYIVMVDPVDGSANIDVNGIISSIFSVHDTSGSGDESLLQRGSEQVAAGYIMYGPATVLVYTAGHGVHSFVLDSEIGEFILDQESIRMP
jgi:fructose-1,6-bisphosphatase I